MISKTRQRGVVPYQRAGTNGAELGGIHLNRSDGAVVSPLIVLFFFFLLLLLPGPFDRTVCQDSGETGEGDFPPPEKCFLLRGFFPPVEIPLFFSGCVNATPPPTPSPRPSPTFASSASLIIHH